MKIVENRKKFFAASLIVIIIGFAAMIFNAQAGRGAFQYDVEFTGGTSFDLDLGQEYKQEDLQKIITDVTGQDSPQIQQVIGTNEVTVKIQSIDSATRETLTNAILEAYPNAVMGEVNDVSGTVSHEMQTAAIKATLIEAISTSDEMSDGKMDKATLHWMKIEEYLKTHDYIMNADVRKLCGVSAATANRILSSFVEERKLNKYREGGHWAYQIVNES